MAQPLILRHSDWPGLIAELAARADYAYLREIPLPVASAVLAAPAAIARWIAMRAPGLAQQPALSILVIGAETTDAPDQGRWYQLLPQLLDASFAVKATLIGAELDTGFASAAAARAPDTPARCVRGGLSEFMARHGTPGFSLAVVFQPGLQKHQGWLAEGGFARLLAAGVPVIASSYETDEFEMDRWVLECYGYRASSAPLLNPFFLELSDDRSSVRWGRALWQFEAAPPPGSGVNRERLAALDTLTRMVMHSITEVGMPSPGYGAQVELQSTAGTHAPLVHVFDNRFVELANGRVVHLTAEGEARDVGSIPPDALARYPGLAARDIERAVWAAEIKSRYLLKAYPRRTDKPDTALTARGMLSAMREKAASLFRK
ncbi:MAG: hypothetical protein HY525_01060 [Betaproteobacteria bacterium]|nr:hypothetical protein [Betaproteobacteria bacterium]